MNWRNVYMKIINNAKIQQDSRIEERKNGRYYENHHILPQAIYPQFKKTKKNQVLLTAREHFICHKIAVKIWPGKSTSFALWRMITSSDKCKTSIEYQTAKENFSRYMSEESKERWKDLEHRTYVIMRIKEVVNSPECKEKRQQWYDSVDGNKWRNEVVKRNKNGKFNLGKFHSEETKKKISESRQGISPWNKKLSLTEEHKKNISKSLLNRDSWNKGLTGWWTEKCYASQKKTEEMKLNMSIAAKKRFENPEERAKMARNLGKSWYNNGVQTKSFKGDEVPEGWVKGRLKVNRPKGLSYKKEIKNED